MSVSYKKILDICIGAKIAPTQHFIFVDIAESALYHFDGNCMVKSYKISTSRNPPSCREGSLGTPTGLHKIDGKIGGGLPLDTVFRGRKPDGTLPEQTPEELKKNLICARIMRLRGLEDGINSGGDVDTYSRYVYIHGTNQEDKIGSPNSHGCVLLRCCDAKRLFDIARDGDIVLISAQ